MLKGMLKGNLKLFDLRVVENAEPGAPQLFYTLIRLASELVIFELRFFKVFEVACF